MIKVRTVAAHSASSISPAGSEWPQSCVYTVGAVYCSASRSLPVPAGTSRNVELQLQRKITWLLRLLPIEGEHDPFSSRPLLSLTCSLFARPRPGALLRLPG
jgi:hypothetical protein